MVSRNSNSLPLALVDSQEIQSPSFELVATDAGTSASPIVSHNSNESTLVQQHSQEIPDSSPIYAPLTVQQVSSGGPSASFDYDENEDDDNDQNMDESESVQTESSVEKIEHLEISIAGTPEEINLMEVVGTFIESRMQKQRQISEERDQFHQLWKNPENECQKLEGIIRTHKTELTNTKERSEEFEKQIKEKDARIMALITEKNNCEGKIREELKKNEDLMAELKEKDISLQQILIKQDADKIELLRIKELLYTMETKFNDKRQSFETLVKDIKTSKEKVVSSVQKTFEYIVSRYANGFDDASADKDAEKQKQQQV